MLRLVLDSNILGRVCHPKPATNRALASWVLDCLSSPDQRIVIPEIADYEVRRELLRGQRIKGVRRLDRLKLMLGYLPLNTSMMMQAAELWAAARQSGQPTAVDAALDSDVILAAQAKSLIDSRLDVIVATDNVGHISRFVPARRWEEIAP